MKFLKKDVAKAITHGDKDNTLNTNKRNYQDKYIKELNKKQEDCIAKMRKKQIESFKALAKTLAEGTLINIAKQISGLDYLCAEDRNLLTKMVFNEISVKIETISLGGIANA